MVRPDAGVLEHEPLPIANLSRGRLGHERANFLGSSLFTQSPLGAIARTARPENERPEFRLVVNEFVNLSIDAFASMLAEARRYRLCLTLSHRYKAHRAGLHSQPSDFKTTVPSENISQRTSFP